MSRRFEWDRTKADRPYDGERKETIRTGLRDIGLAGRDVAVHSSLRSFGHVHGGAQSVVRALLAVCGSVIVPTYCEIGRTNPPAGDRPLQNGWDYADYRIRTNGLTPFDPLTFDRTSDIEVGEMGRIPATLLQLEETVRSKHPSVSWAASGPLAEWYVADHTPEDPNLPLKRLLEREGSVLLLGVDLATCTAIHLAEELAGRRPFVRWILYTDGAIRRVREYGCSDGFPKLAPHVDALATRVMIGSCQAVCFPIRPFVEAVVSVIRAQPEITLCGRRELCRCQDAVKGGPIDE